MIFQKIFFINLLFCSGGPLDISTKFMDGNVTFSWEGDPAQLYYVRITRDGVPDRNWNDITGIQFTVMDALLYDSIRIRVAVQGGTTNNMTYKGILYMFNCCNSYRSKLTNNDSS